MTKQVRRAAKKLFHFCLVSGALDEARIMREVQRISESGKRSRFTVLSQLLRLVKHYREHHTATVESAMSLPNEMRDHIQAGLRKVYGPGLDISFTQLPALLGGMRIKIGSDVYDGSVRARLAALEARF